MNLHENKELFRHTILKVSERSGIPEHIIEKDYYCCALLNEISNMKFDESFCIGGTFSFQKQLDIQRSIVEGFELYVDITEHTETAGKKVIDTIFSKIETLNRTTRYTKHEGPIAGGFSIIYDYDPVFKCTDRLNATDINRFDSVCVKAMTSVFNSTVRPVVMWSLIEKYSTLEERHMLKGKYNVVPFVIKTKSISDEMVNCLFNAETAYKEQDYVAFSKNAYDLISLASSKQAMEIVKEYCTYKQHSEFARSVNKKRKFDENGVFVLEMIEEPIDQFKVMNIDVKEAETQAIKNAHITMSQRYNFSRVDILTTEVLLRALSKLSNVFKRVQGV